MNTILYKLENCSLCKSVENRLKELGIEYNVLNCSDKSNESLCDHIEKVIGTYNYPIISMHEDRKTVHKGINPEISLKTINESGSTKIILYSGIAGLLINIMEK